MKKRLGLVLTSIATSIAAFVLAFSSSNIQNIAPRASTSEVWVHYQGVAPTLNEKGTKEYWISCSSNEHQFTAPVGVTIHQGDTLSRSFINSLPSNDDRLVPCYTEIMGFEDGNIPTYVTPKEKISSLTVVDEGTEGSKCMKITVSGSNYGVKFAKAYLDAVFADPNIVAINFDAKGSINSSNFRARIGGNNITYEMNNTSYGLTTEWKKFSFRRSYYQAFIDSEDAMIYGGGLTSGNYVLVDNIIPVTEELTSFGFENGYYNASSKIYMSAGHSNNDPSPAQTLKLSPDSKCTLSDIGFDYSDKTEGNRSFTFTKTNEYVAIYLSTDIKNSLGEGAFVKFDFKTSVAINSNPSVSNAKDGQNNPLGGSGYRLNANEWITLTYPASTGMSADGRFLIIQGSTAGTMHIDNIRFEYYEDALNTSIFNRNIYVDDTTGSTFFATKRTPIGVGGLKVDGVSVALSNIKSWDNSGVYLSNSYLSTLPTGDHKFVISYYYNKNHLIDETYYQNVYFGTLKSAVSVSTSYGSSDYYTLPGTYTNLYRIVCNGMDIPFERIDGGSTYSVPYASLIEALPTVNNQKSTGSIVLHIFTIDELFRLPVTVNLTTTTVKSITQFNGGDIPSFFYSSTQHGAEASADYETYRSIDKLTEYYNVGCDIAYEQYFHVGANHSSLTVQLKLLLNNAAKLNRKVILSDDAFTLLGRETSSIIGRDVTVGSATLHFNNTSELDTYVTNRLNLYIGYSSCYGVNVGDEENYNQLIGGYTDLLHSIHRCLTALHREDFFVNCNLHPMSADKEIITGTSGSYSSETDRNNSYKAYLNAYVEASGNNYISYDYYPLGNGNFASGKAVGPYALRNLILVAQVAKEHNLDVHVVGQTYSFSHSSSTLILNSEDVAFINNMMLAFGVRCVKYFTFYHRGDTGSETWLPNGCPMTSDGTRTNLYYYMKAQIEQIKAMAPIINCFDFEWFYIRRAGSSSSSYLINPDAYVWLLNNKPYSSTSYNQLSSFASPSKSWVYMNGLVNSATGQHMYVVQNLHRDKNQGSISNTTQLNFNSSVNYFAVYENGSVRIVNPVVSGSYKRITLTLSSGHAAFIIPY